MYYSNNHLKHLCMDILKELNAEWMKEARQEKISLNGNERASKLISRGNGISNTDGRRVELIPRPYYQYDHLTD